MRGFWSRDFLRKSLDSEFVSLHAMTPADWRVLEYENLRNRAKNRIAEMIIDGELIGFYRVNIVEKAKAKSRYFQPVSDVTIEDEHGGFENSVDDEALSDDAESLNMILSDAVLIPVASLALLAVSPEWFEFFSAGRTKEKVRDDIEAMNPEDVALYMTATLFQAYGDPDAIEQMYRAGLITRETYDDLYWSLDMEDEGFDEGPE